MKILHSWLNEFADFGNDVDAIAASLTKLGLAVESVEQVGLPVKGVVVAKGGALDVPNSAIGLCFYLLALAPWDRLGPAGGDAFMVAALASLAFSAYLAYVLRYILHEFCIICVTSYCVNALLFFSAGAFTLRMHARAEKSAMHAALVKKAAAQGLGKQA